MPKEKHTNCKLVANIKSRRIAKCSEIHQNIHCPKFNVKNIRVYVVRWFKRYFVNMWFQKTLSRLDFLLKVSVSKTLTETPALLITAVDLLIIAFVSIAKCEICTLSRKMTSFRQSENVIIL